MRWARIVFGGVFVVVGAALIGLVLLYAAQPSSYRIARTRTIAATPAEVMPHLSDLHAFVAWDPWPRLPGAPPATVTYSTPATGVGAWVERRDAEGGARSTIASVTPTRLEMTNVTNGALAAGHSTQVFELRAVPGGTEVTWALSSDLHGLARMLWPFVGLEARVGPEMDQALTRLDAACR